MKTLQQIKQIVTAKKKPYPPLDQRGCQVVDEARAKEQAKQVNALPSKGQPYDAS
jgi:hypothetical protein